MQKMELQMNQQLSLLMYPLFQKLKQEVKKGQSLRAEIITIHNVPVNDPIVLTTETALKIDETQKNFVETGQDKEIEADRTGNKNVPVLKVEIVHEEVLEEQLVHCFTSPTYIEEHLEKGTNCDL